MTEIRELPRKEKRKLPGISGFRALAALSVVFYHLNQHRTIANLAEWNWDLYKLTELLPFVVSFFFVLGGALHSLPFWRVIFTRDSGGKEFVPEPKNALIDRFFRIAPAYYAALIASFIVVWVVQ